MVDWAELEDAPVVPAANEVGVVVVGGEVPTAVPPPPPVPAKEDVPVPPRLGREVLILREGAPVVRPTNDLAVSVLVVVPSPAVLRDGVAPANDVANEVLLPGEEP